MGPNRQNKRGGGKASKHGKDPKKAGRGGRGGGGGGGGANAATGPGRGGGFRGVEIAYDPFSDEVTMMQKPASGRKGVEKVKKVKKFKDPAAKKKEAAPELKLDLRSCLQLEGVLKNYQRAQRIMQRDLGEGRVDDSSPSESSSDSFYSDEDSSLNSSEDDEDTMQRGDRRVKTAAGLVREMNSPAFYGHRDDFYSDEHADGSDDSEDDDGDTWAEPRASRVDDGQNSENSSDGLDFWANDPVPVNTMPRQLVFIPTPDPKIPTDDFARSWLESLGFSRPHATAALQHAGGDQFEAIAYLYSQAAETTFTVTPDGAVSVTLADDAASQRASECMVLESIYGADFSRILRKDGTSTWKITGLEVEVPHEFDPIAFGGTDRDFLSHLELTLQLHHASSTLYPFQMPIITLDLCNKLPGSRVYSAGILALTLMLQTLAQTHLGESLTDLLTMTLQTAEASACILNPTARVRELMTANSVSPNKVLTIRGSTNRTPRKQVAAPATAKLVRGPHGRPPAASMLRLKVDVAICLKEDQGSDRLVRGKISELLTRGDHPRGIKVRLTDGRVGRVQAVVEAPTLAPPAAQVARSISTTPKSQTPTDLNTLSNQMSAMRIHASIPAPSPKTPVFKPKPLPRKSKPQSNVEQVQATSELLYDQFLTQQKTPAFIKMQQQRQKLPAWNFRHQILDAIEQHSVVVVEGETGCGKTTQVPQFILDRFLEQKRGGECRILVTQPRRISAIGVAERVASERAEVIGKTVGYQIRLESRMSDETRILFATTGILLRRLEGAGAQAMGGDQVVTDDYDGGIDELTHIIVDEVHERSVDSDFLLMVLRDILAANKRLKIILMSATLNAGLFQEYFGATSTPRIHVPGRTFPVEVLFLEDALAKTAYKPEGKDFTKTGFVRSHPDPNILEADLPDALLDEAQLAKRYPRLPKNALAALKTIDIEKIQYPLIERLVEWMSDVLLPGASKTLPPGAHPGTAPKGKSALKGGATPKSAKALKSGTQKEGGFRVSLPFDDPLARPDRGILIFLPGFMEIAACHDALQKNPAIRAATANGRWLLPLHGNLSSIDQLRVFKRPEAGAVKIVIATNVAETSITVDDVVFVVDSGRMKETRYDPAKGMSSLEEWVLAYTDLLGALVDLPSLQILAKVIEPPSQEAVTQAVMTLRTLQALTQRENLTPLGFHLGRLPLDVRIGKLLVYGSIFQCLDPVLTIAAAMSHKSPFVAPFEIRHLADAKKREFAIESSDQLTILNAYNEWQRAKDKGFAAEKKFLFDNFLSGRTLRGCKLQLGFKWKDAYLALIVMIANIKRQLAELVSDIGFLPSGTTVRSRDMERDARRNFGRKDGPVSADGVLGALGVHANQRADDLKLVKALLLAALYPNVVKLARGVKPSDESVLVVRGNEEVFIHPTSINFRKPLPPTSFVVYHEKVRTSKVFLRDSSVVTSLALAFFGGNLTWDGRKRLLDMEDGWIRFKAAPRVAAVVDGCRTALDELLEKKIEDPSFDIASEPLVSVICDVVSASS
ncbi:ATPdependent RNA helicase [Thoreauomyces humboldtii]|nr:ATPdependent RNA helicase [Thoreauomyces humboldtii]